MHFKNTVERSCFEASCLDEEGVERVSWTRGMVEANEWYCVYSFGPLNSRQSTVKMAEVDFGDSELFQQLDDSMPVSSHIRFTDQETDQEDTPKFKEKLGGCEETNQRLIEENILLVLLANQLV